MITLVECKFATFWIMFEVFATSALTILIAGYIILGRYFGKKCLKGSTVLITNGDSKLSQEIARQMISDHQCKVILVLESNTAVVVKDAHTRFSFDEQPTVYQCNTLDHSQVKQLSNEISRTNGVIDILIENAKSSSPIKVKSTTCSTSSDYFIEETSNKIITTLNLLIHFIPKLQHSTRRGHFVTIRSESNGAKPFLKTSSEIKMLMRNLSIEQDMKPGMPNELCLSTVVCNDHKSDNKLLKKLELNLHEIAATIIRGIQSEKHIIAVSERRSLIDYIFKIIKFKCS